MEWHDVISPLPDCVVSLAKNAPSIDMGEWLAADRLTLMGWSSSREKPQAMKSHSDHKSDCAPLPVLPGWERDIVTETLG